MAGRRPPTHSTAKKRGKTMATPPAAGMLAGGMITSKVTERLQTTLPRGVRQVLDIHPGQRLGYVIDATGVRLINVTRAAHEDPTIQGFLRLLGSHMDGDPMAAIVPFPAELLARARAVTEGVAIDHDAPIEGAIAL